MTDWDSYVDAVAGPLGLTIAPEYRPGVTGFLAIAAGMAAILDRVDLDPAELELAPVYRLPDFPAEAPETR